MANNDDASEWRPPTPSQRVAKWTVILVVLLCALFIILNVLSIARAILNNANFVTGVRIALHYSAGLIALLTSFVGLQVYLNHALGGSRKDEALALSLEVGAARVKCPTTGFGLILCGLISFYVLIVPGQALVEQKSKAGAQVESSETIKVGKVADLLQVVIDASGLTYDRWKNKVFPAYAETEPGIRESLKASPNAPMSNFMDSVKQSLDSKTANPSDETVPAVLGKWAESLKTRISNNQ